MDITTSKIFPEVLKICPDVYKDFRGNFVELYSINTFPIIVSDLDFVQDNISYSTQWVLRGLHFQLPPFEQGKLVTCLSGTVLDFAVDLRKNSPTFGKWDYFVLNGDLREQVWIPAGFAHGFTVPRGEASVHYKVTSVWNKQSERTLLWNDPDIGIVWSVDTNFTPIISQKDKEGKTLEELMHEL